MNVLQAFLNLLSNAAKFSLKNGVIDINLYLKGKSKVVISVADKGSGISESFKDKIFNKFSQSNSSDTRSKDGSGLGLNIAKSIIESLKGNLEFKSEEGKGSIFYIILPIYKSKK